MIYETENNLSHHEFRPMAEHLYNALPFFFPNGQDGNMNTYGHLLYDLEMGLQMATK